MTEQETERAPRWLQPYRVGSAMLALCGIVSLAVALFIAANGDPIYGSLYTAPALISFMFSYAIWGIKHD